MSRGVYLFSRCDFFCLRLFRVLGVYGYIRGVLGWWLGVGEFVYGDLVVRCLFGEGGEDGDFVIFEVVYLSSRDFN